MRPNETTGKVKPFATTRQYVSSAIRATPDMYPVT